MKIRRSAAAAALAASGAYAQTTGAPPAYEAGSSSPAPVQTSSTSYVTLTIDDCPTMSMETMITITNGVTLTVCPECEMMSSSSPKPTGPGYTTTYTTTYMSLCPTGMVPATYTVTESCTDDKATWTPGPTHIPDGFTVTEKECTVCGKETPTVTITEPCGCKATNGVPVTNPAANTTPAGGNNNGGSPPAATGPACNGDDCGGSGNQTPGGNTPSGNTPSGDTPSGNNSPSCDGDDCGGSGSAAPSGGSPACEGDDCGGSGSGSAAPGGSSPVTQIGDGQIQAPTGGAGSPSCTGDDCAGSANTSPAPSAGGSNGGANAPYPTTMESCPGPNCRAVASSYPSGVDYGNTSMIVPSSGAATGLGTNLFTTLITAALAVAGLAFML
ncbi:hypothetical protein KC332_g8622 [Hortaea werneckii]|uniref:Uncharacterized protein n=1 Tax=Hortaea werneckii EXF-2000 TaxID=1157616 RepID=A0A1Z5SZW5_HORWE|nr:hypothetical protein KC358_g17137 [Hortaea werneckii]OTA27841.1 hypothetical protein BTJ68_11371 [Hortaea werneckii EXF-2000]KAI6796274.1 hypothetical protein KC350_g16853 [Hortaea werneckii]KAI6922408.1 hypothetical protein KC348_g9795 [Hortaea werneckii]KAI6931876.1 hypothetical protein KC341_g9343 [Hortaea werneckii]